MCCYLQGYICLVFYDDLSGSNRRDSRRVVTRILQYCSIPIARFRHNLVLKEILSITFEYHFLYSNFSIQF